MEHVSHGPWIAQCPGMIRPHVLLAHSQPLLLEGVRVLLAADYEIVDIVSDGRSLVEAALRTRPELIILGAALPRLNGVDAAAQIKTGLPGVKLLFFTESPVHLNAALKAGATSYVLKSCNGIELLDAVKSVLNNRIYVTPSVSPEQLEQFTDASRAAAAVNLTMREREILQLVAEGQATKEIAYGLAISINTVSFHRGNLRKKIGLHGTAGLTRHAIARGLACG